VETYIRPSEVAMRNLALFAVVLLPWKALGQDRPPSTGARRVTLEQVKQSVDPPAANPLTRLGQLQIEAAKQHRLAVQADYYPKFGAFFSNLHSTQFLGQVLRFPMTGMTPVNVQIINKDQTTAALTFTQPITPLFTIHQAVKIARRRAHRHRQGCGYRRQKRAPIGTRGDLFQASDRSAPSDPRALET
jgi:Outer membrane efflux protein